MPYTAVSWSSLRAQLLAKWEKVPFWSDEEALLAVNEALRFYNLLTGRWHRREVLPTVTGQLLYTTSAAMLYRTRVAWESRPLASASVAELDSARPNWRQETIASGGDVPTRPTAFAPVSLRSFYLWPADVTGVTSPVLTIDGIAATPVLVSDEDEVDLGEELISILLGYALHVASFKKGGPFFAVTAPYFKAFLAAAAEENGQIKTSAIYRRWMGLDRQALKPLRGAPTLLDPFVGGRPA